MYGPNASDSIIANVLAHELSHRYQSDGRREQLLDEIGREYLQTTDGGAVQRALVEGGPTYVADTYADEHLSDSRNLSEEIAPRWDDFGIVRRVMWSGHYLGAAYLHQRIDSPQQLDEVYADPPRTTEQVLHPERGDEPPRNLTVTANTSASAWETGRRDVRGEMYTRILLGPALGSDRAAEAAAGWGMDREVVFFQGSDQGHAWVLRWDDAANATEFEGAFEAFLDQRANATDGRWSHDGHAFDVLRVSDETVVVLWGDAGFVDGATVTGDDGSITVMPPATNESARRVPVLG
ncbi:hypothetical protein [Haloarchaeobius litoreus]|uniref:Uncharacterized protein n=1 Tax=Haloarchaeobius litoreus TaxID=755306 RepID=A0ABD6DLV7_9EURY|nr:hypothetical protein [Haloarchaeobius litoreus]